MVGLEGGLIMKPLRSILRFALSTFTATAVGGSPFLVAKSHAACQLNSPGNQIQRVIYIQFDNTHFRRDNVNVPSDLEQMPSLLNFMRNNGTILTNDHTVLISHTAVGILSSLTGVYPDRHGQTVSNSYVRTSNTGVFTFPSSFGYWTDPVSATGTPTVPSMITPDGKNAPAPFVPYTRAGCDVGAVATANIVLENTGTGATGDITKVFGAGSPEFLEAQASAAAPSGSAARNLAQTDFVGIAIHCGAGGGICAGNQNARPDQLTDEPGGYNGFLGLFGAKYVNPAITHGSTTVNALSSPSQPIADQFGQPGFPGFDGMFAATSLAYIAQMQEAGIPITFAYISDAHDFHGVAGEVHTAFGPGDPAYVAQLKAYDAAFAAFFARLAADGINKNNTLFVFTVDEGDHFVGVTKTNCDGVTVPCIYGTNEVGEIMSNIDTLVQNQFPGLAAQFLGSSAANAFTVHGDDAPTFYLAKKGSGPLAQTDPLTRAFEQSMANLTAVNPYTNVTDRLLFRLADQTEMKLLHMITTGDPVRNATFTYFADANYFITDFPTNTCETCIGPAFAWNHGDDQSEIGNTWIGYVGPGITNRGQDDTTWSDHTDARPTMLWLLGLQDSYLHDGRVLVEAIDNLLLTGALSTNTVFKNLATIYKQINAPFGQLGNDTLLIATTALASNTANDAMYTALQNKIAGWTTLRDTIAGKMRAVLSAAAFSGQTINEARAAQYISLGQGLLAEVSQCAAKVANCAGLSN
jgi:hypothetical protein